MKIHDTKNDMKDAPKKRVFDADTKQEIESKHHNLDTLTKVIQNKYHSEPQARFTVRLHTDLETTLKVYADEQDLTIPKSIERICRNYFKDRWITRSFFELDSPFTVAIPITTHEIGKYITDEINCIINLSSDIETRLAVQTQLISNDDTDYYLAVTFKYGNNYLDVYDAKNDRYFSEIHAKEYHLGLYDIYIDFIEESVFLEVLFHEKTPVYATLLSFEDVMELAEKQNNKLVLEYLKGIDEALIMQKYKTEMQEQKTYIQTLEAQIESLENELSKLKHEKQNKEAETTETETTETSKKMDLGMTPKQTIPPETQKALANAMMTIAHLQRQYQEAIKPINNVLKNMNYPTVDDNSNSKE